MLRSLVGSEMCIRDRTSGVWKYVMEFEPPVKNKNITCFVKRKLPASGSLPAREVVCGHLMKYQRAENGKKSGGTNGIWNQFKKDHPVEYAAVLIPVPIPCRPHHFTFPCHAVCNSRSIKNPTTPVPIPCV